MPRLVPLLLALSALAGCRNGGVGTAIEECVPGETVIVGCAASCGIGRCEGDPVLRICDGALGVDGCREAADGMFVDTDDSCSSLCPRARVVCPASGSIAVLTRAVFSGRYVCEWEAEHRGILPPGGRAGETIACTAGAPVEVGCSLACGVGECDGNASIDGRDPGDELVVGLRLPLPAVRRDVPALGLAHGRAAQHVVRRRRRRLLVRVAGGAGAAPRGRDRGVQPGPALLRRMCGGLRDGELRG
jgi:hypothetical protein